jgi:hypothetical protein
MPCVAATWTRKVHHQQAQKWFRALRARLAIRRGGLNLKAVMVSSAIMASALDLRASIAAAQQDRKRHMRLVFVISDHEASRKA